MPVTEVKMGWGDFSIPLKKDTPRHVIHNLDLTTAGHGFIRVFPQRVSTEAVTAGRSLDLFAGKIIGRPDRYTITGHHVTMMLGENSNSHDLYSEETGPMSVTVPIAHNGTSSGSLTQWATDCLDVPACEIHLGQVLGSGYAAGTIFGAIFVRKTPKTLLDTWITHRFKVVYQVRNDLTLDIGLPQNVWRWTNIPLAIKRGGRDLNIDGLNAVQLGLDVDLTEWANRAVVFIETPSALAVSYQPAGNPFNSARDGNPLNWTKSFIGQSASQTSTAEATNDATNQAEMQADVANQTQQITVSTAEYALTRRVSVGDLLFVYDVEEGLFDQANTVTYHGKTVYPARLQVQAITWPLEQGMSVWYDNRHGTRPDLIDLTDYIDFSSESKDTSITVGGPPPRLGKVLRIIH